MTDPLRLTGLFSTFDVEGVIAQLAQARSGILTKLDQKSAQAAARRNTLASVQSRFITLLSRASQIGSAVSVSGKSAAVTGTGVTASALPSAATGTFSVDVLQLATATTVGGSAISAGVNADAPMGASNFATAPTNGTFTIATATGGTQTFTIGPAAANAAVPLDGANFTVAPLAGTFTIATENGGAETFTIDPTTQSLDDVVQLINNAGIGVTATLTNDANGRANQLTLTSTQGTITLGDAADTSNFLAATNLKGVTAGETMVSAATFTTQMALNEVITEINASGIGVTAALANDENGRPNILSLSSSLGAITLGNAGDTSTFLQATNLLASPGTTARASTIGIARMKVNDRLEDAAWHGGPPAAGAQSFTINGVTINYNTASDSLADVIARINASTANVTARYDVISDTVKLENSKPGSLGITLADDGGGDLLAKLGLLSAMQTLGKNAEYQVDGGPVQYAPSNTVSLPSGVTLTLTAKTEPGTPATVSITQDATAAVNAVRGFVTEINGVFQAIEAATKADRTAPGSLSGDASLRQLQSSLRSMLSNPGTGIDGVFTRLDQIGISFGAVGSALGTTNTLQLDETKFRAALAGDPGSVQALLSTFTLTPELTPGGTGSITGISGKFTGTVAGTYQISDNGAGMLTAVFTPSNGGPSSTTSVTATVNGTVTGLIPGMEVAIGPAFSQGTHTIRVSATARSPIMAIKELVEVQAGAGGVLQKRQDSYTAVTRRVAEQRVRAQERIDHEMSVWRRRFQEMELAQARYASVASSLEGMIAQLQANRQ